MSFESTRKFAANTVSILFATILSGAITAPTSNASCFVTEPFVATVGSCDCHDCAGLNRFNVTSSRSARAGESGRCHRRNVPSDNNGTHTECISDFSVSHLIGCIGTAVGAAAGCTACVATGGLACGGCFGAFTGAGRLCADLANCQFLTCEEDPLTASAIEGTKHELFGASCTG